MAVSVISDLDLRVVRLSFRDPVRFGRDRISARDAVVVRVIDEHGRVGLGETLEPPHPDAVTTARSWAVGRTPDELHASGGPWSLGLLPLRMCGALDSALLDLRARQAGVSAAALIGAAEARTDVRVNALLAISGPGDDAAASAARLVDGGVRHPQAQARGRRPGRRRRHGGRMLSRAVRGAAGAPTACASTSTAALHPDAAHAWLPDARGPRAWSTSSSPSRRLTGRGRAGVARRDPGAASPRMSP